MLRKIGLILGGFLLFLSVEAKLPDITSKDALNLMNKILSEHFLYKELTPELVERTFDNYLNLLDSHKSYFIESDIEKWIHPSRVLTIKVLREIKRGDFEEFEKMQEAMKSVIARRNALEERLEKEKLPTSYSNLDYKELNWSKSEGELFNRLLEFHAAQVESAMKSSDDEFKRQVSQYIKKYRISKEAKAIGETPEDRRKIVLVLFLKAFCSALDDHTDYFTPSEANQFAIEVEQRLFGIGAQLKDSLNGFSVVSLVEGGPALKSGKLKIGDKIIAVNKVSIIGMDGQDAIERIRGEKGTPVLLTISRESTINGNKRSEVTDIELIRGEVVLEESRLENMNVAYGDGDILVLRLSSFYQDPSSSSGDDIRKAILKAKKEGVVNGIILDLRNNGGGLLPQAVAVAGQFLKKGVVVSVKDNTGTIKSLRNIEDEPVWDGPLIVLVNKVSASASEIVAQALQDYGRAIIVGDEYTFGKGTFQSFSLDVTKSRVVINPKGEYKVTRGLYYTVSGRSPEVVGVKADIVVPGVFAYMDLGERFSKYPIPNSSIEPLFKDGLRDLPPMYREKAARFYYKNMQERIDLYAPYIERLRAASEKRIKQSKAYQKFIAAIKEKNFNLSLVEASQQVDIKLHEAENIMRDLIYFSSQENADNSVDEAG